jgi:putative cardiolipin synthase
VDNRRIFVGSFNFDPRSARLNTEMGLVIDSAVLARKQGEFFDRTVPRLAYEVRLAPDGERLQWIERTDSGEKLYDTDPATNWFLRAKVNVLSVLPIDWLL